MVGAGPAAVGAGVTDVDPCSSVLISVLMPSVLIPSDLMPSLLMPDFESAKQQTGSDRNITTS